MTLRSLLAAIVVAAPVGLAGVHDAGAADCVGSGSLSRWGNSMTAQFPIASGQSCSYGFSYDGEMYESRIVQPPRHGTATMINMSTIEYRAHAGYKGRDSFKVQARGKGPSSQGVSVITLNAIVR